MENKNLELVCLGCRDDKQSVVLQCSSKLTNHGLCAKCVIPWVRTKTEDTNSFDFKCPLFEECQSEIDPDLTYDIASASQMPENSLDVNQLRKMELNAALGNDTKICCPNCPYFYIIDDNSDMFFEPFAQCPKCKTSFCLTCNHTLGRHGYRDHVCAVDTCITNEKVRHDLEELLTDAATFRCKTCVPSAPITKQDGDCNVIKCSQCSIFYCYICNKKLGPRNMRAHENFPHPNEGIPTAPECWLFDMNDDNKNVDEAINLRKIYKAKMYFDSLEIGQTEKEEIIAVCGDLLGDLKDVILQQYNNSRKNKCKIQ
ncbi:uncharacterized protein DDB_G0292642-like [Exaiptasia diaphana]|uniref:RING-type domain-containing protein n=1 Tax=Exaiptasia diaphana TaxID=2652724 RepID=A0A913XEZ8_EXADI|nr:uncharacterized protein DDB_G0292642-like [Exaiptasia diaphana]